jgi:hypothetical protein
VSAEWVCEYCGCCDEDHGYEQTARYCLPLREKAHEAELAKLRAVLDQVDTDLAGLHTMVRAIIAIAPDGSIHKDRLQCRA